MAFSSSLYSNGNFVVQDLIEMPSRICTGSSYYFSTMDSTTARIAAYRDGTHIYINGSYETTLNKQETYTYVSTMGDVINSNMPLSIGSNSEGGVVPFNWWGTEFSFYNYRYSPSVVIYAPFESASVNIFCSTSGSSTPIDTITLAKGQYNNYDTSATIANVYVIESDKPIVCYALGNNGDNRPLYPNSTNLIGIPGGSANLSYSRDNTITSTQRSNGNAGNTSGNKCQQDTISSTGNQYVGDSFYIISNKPIGIESLADGDGGDGTRWISKEAMATEFVLPDLAEFVAITGLVGSGSLTLKVYDATGSLRDTITCNTGSGYSVDEKFPSKIYILGTDVSYPLEAGLLISSSYPVHAIYEDNSTNNETNLFGIGETYGYDFVPINSSGSTIVQELNEVDSQYASDRYLTVNRNGTVFVSGSLIEI